MASDKVQYETVIRQVKGEDTFTIRTSNRKLKNRLHGYDLEPDDEAGATETYEEVPGNWLRIQRPRQFTEEEIEETRNRLSKALGRDKPAKKGAKAAKPKAKPVVEDDDDDEDEEDEVSKKRAAKSKSAAKGKGKAAVDDDDDDGEIDDDPDDDDDEDEPVEVVKKPAAKKPAAKKR